MNIVFVTQSIGYGGAAKMQMFVANELANRGHRVSIINLNITAKEVAQHIDEKITVYNLNGKVRLLKKLSCAKQIQKIAKNENADLLIGFTLFPNFFVVLAGKMGRIPCIISERGDPRLTIEAGWQSRLLFKIVNRSTGGVFQTDGAQAYYGKHLRKNGVVIPNPIFVKGEVPDVAYADRKKTVVCVGRLQNSQKRYDVMLRAFRLFHDQHPEYVLKLYGNGPDEERIVAWAQEYGVADSVRFLGVTHSPMQAIAKDGMFLITSDYEGISNSLLEAMATGLPCVSTDHTPGGARFLITDHENGLLAPIGDAEKLAKAMCEFAENPELAEKCGKNAKQVLERFAPERIIDMWEEYCLKLTRGKI